MGVGVSNFPGKKRYEGLRSLLALRGVGVGPISRKKALNDPQKITLCIILNLLKFECSQ